MSIPFNQPLASLAHRITTEQTPPLPTRLQLGKALTKAVCRVQSLGYVHKSIRPRSILLVRNDSSADGSQNLYLQRWNHARNQDSVSAHLGEHLWQRAIYQNPDRQSEFAMAGFEPYHDIYSLGVCLLEIFLWTPFTIGSPLPKLFWYDSAGPLSEIDQELKSPVKILALFEKKLAELGIDPSRLYNNVCELMSETILSQEVW